MSQDEIKMDITTQLTDRTGQPIEVKTQQPEYLVETFSINDTNNSSYEIITENKE